MAIILLVKIIIDTVDLPEQGEAGHLQVKLCQSLLPCEIKQTHIEHTGKEEPSRAGWEQVCRAFAMGLGVNTTLNLKPTW